MFSFRSAGYGSVLILDAEGKPDVRATYRVARIVQREHGYPCDSEHVLLAVSRRCVAIALREYRPEDPATFMTHAEYRATWARGDLSIPYEWATRFLVFRQELLAFVFPMENSELAALLPKVRHSPAEDWQQHRAMLRARAFVAAARAAPVAFPGEHLPIL